jgi:DNA-binding LacI/PurR family transcriptional regulator
MVSQRVIAKRLGISQITVSRIINGYEHVTPELREKVLAEIERTGYRLNENARNLITGRTGKLCMLTPDLSFWQRSPFFTHIFQGISEAAQLNHYSITLSSLDNLSGLDADAFIGLNFGNIGLKLIDLLNQMPQPSIILQSHAGGDYDCIGLDNEYGGKLAAQHLLELGHTSFLFLGKGECRDSEDRYKGFAEGIGSNGKLETSGAATEQLAEMIMQMPSEKRVSAVFAWSDLSALQFLHTCAKRGIAVPEDISLVGFDDFQPLSTAFSPTLTTIRQPLYEMGKETVRLLLSGKDETRNRIIFKPELVVRESTTAKSSKSGNE